LLLTELIERIYPGINRIEPKHRIIVARAAKGIPTLACTRRDTLGRELIFYLPDRVLSYSMMRIKAENIGPEAEYRNSDPRWKRRRAQATRWAPKWHEAHPVPTQETLQNGLAEGGKHHKFIVEGGAWWRHTEEHNAKARGDNDALERLRIIAEEENAKWMADFKRAMGEDVDRAFERLLAAISVQEITEGRGREMIAKLTSALRPKN
jgi:hypothetical protein